MPANGPDHSPVTVLLLDDGSAAAHSIAAVLENGTRTVTRVDALPAVNEIGVLDTTNAVLLPGTLPPADVWCLDRAAAIAAGRPPVLVYTDEPAVVSSFQQFGVDVLVAPFARNYLERLITGSRHDGDSRGGLVTKLNGYERDLRIGQEVQHSLLPHPLPTLDGWDIQAEMRPAAHVSGDFYDLFPILEGRRTAVLIADVCDKGVGAGLFMALIMALVRRLAGDRGSRTAARQILRHLGEDDADPPGEWIPDLLAAGEAPLLDAVQGTNDYLTGNVAAQGYFATLFIGALDPDSGSLAYVNAGHQTGMLCRAGGGFDLLEPTGPAIGVFDGAGYTVERATIRPGDTLLLYTDGVPEARAADGSLLGPVALRDAFNHPARDAGTVLARVDDLVHAHVGADPPFPDDLTMVAAHRTGGGL
jgi:sigma-B regulation protein RsbU (phosphoserine phosphatase)